MGSFIWSRLSEHPENTSHISLQVIADGLFCRYMTRLNQNSEAVGKYIKTKSGKILCITDLNWPDGYSHDFFTINTINLTHGQWWYEHFDYGTLQIMGLNYYVERTRTGESKFMSNLSHLPDIRW